MIRQAVTFAIRNPCYISRLYELHRYHLMMDKFKIGLLLDSLSVRIWQYHIIEFIIKHPAFEIESVVVNGAKPSGGDNKKYFIYKLFRRLDRKIFKTKT